MIVNALDSLGLSNNTLVVYVTDHGFGYGETRLWEKDIPFDIAARCPFMFRVPWLSSPAIHTGDKLFVSSVDVYRTVSGFLGLSANVSKTVAGRDHSETLLMMADDPIMNGTSSNKIDNSSVFLSSSIPDTNNVAFSQVVRCSVPTKCRGTLRNVDVVGYTARTRDYRYIAYFRAVNGQVFNYTRANAFAEELYDHRWDNETIFNPNGATYSGHEMRNIVKDHPSIAAEMFEMIRAMFESRPKVREPLPLAQLFDLVSSRPTLVINQRLGTLQHQ